MTESDTVPDWDELLEATKENIRLLKDKNDLVPKKILERVYELLLLSLNRVRYLEEQLAEKQTDAWRSVDEYDDSDNILVLREHGSITHIGWVARRDWVSHYYTHWMPAPPLPKEETDDD